MLRQARIPALLCVAALPVCSQTPVSSQRLRVGGEIHGVIGRAVPSRNLGRGWLQFSIAPNLNVQAEAERYGQRSQLSRAILHADFTPGISVDAGRQFFSLGDERLLGANREGGLVSAGWDGARVHFHGKTAEIDVIAARGVVSRTSLTGVEARWKAPGAVELAPYVLRTPITVATGLRAGGSFRGFESAMEAVRENRGRWAAHGHVTRGGTSAELNYASPEFDEISPATLNSYGTEDPFPWSDTLNLAVNQELSVATRLQVGLSYRSFWSASGSYMAQHVVGSVTYGGETWRVTGGYGHLFEVRTCDAPRRTPFVSLSYRF